MILVYIAGDNVRPFIAQLGREESTWEWDRDNIKSLFGDFFAFDGSGQFDNRVEWLEVSGEDLDILSDILVGLPVPRKGADGFPKLGKMRWYGDTARTALWAWIEAEIKDRY